MLIFKFFRQTDRVGLALLDTVPSEPGPRLPGALQVTLTADGRRMARLWQRHQPHLHH